MNNKVFYTTNAVCDSYKLTRAAIVEMVSWGIATPTGNKPDKWLFSEADYVRIGCATRFRNELEVNIPGAALALQLLEELDHIRKEIRHQ